mmetsp:Transcript_41516/g.97375  ORF Transcript_41516/g.97375 Transcript_41516/m.97375 type:complete len:218 (-) Transcript_41516:1287-1940(-)
MPEGLSMTKRPVEPLARRCFPPPTVDLALHRTQTSGTGNRCSRRSSRAPAPCPRDRTAAPQCRSTLPVSSKVSSPAPPALLPCPCATGRRGSCLVSGCCAWLHGGRRGGRCRGRGGLGRRRRCTCPRQRPGRCTPCQHRDHAVPLQSRRKHRPCSDRAPSQHAEDQISQARVPAPVSSEHLADPNIQISSVQQIASVAQAAPVHAVPSYFHAAPPPP